MSREGVDGDLLTAESSSLTSTSSPQTSWRICGVTRSGNITDNNDHNNRTNNASFQSSYLLNGGARWQQDRRGVNATHLIQSLHSAARQKHTWEQCLAYLLHFSPRRIVVMSTEWAQHLQNHKSDSQEQANIPSSTTPLCVAYWSCWWKQWKGTFVAFLLCNFKD